MNLKRTAAYSICLAAFVACCISTMAWKPDPVIYANADPNKYYVECDLTNQITTVFEKSESGKYDKVVKHMISTTGAKATPTPTGSFKFNDRRRRFGYFTKYDVYAQYWIQVNGGIYFHSILYPKPIEGKFTRTSYNNLGSVASHGCIRMLVEDVRWMYYNVPAGTKGAVVKNPVNAALKKATMPKQAFNQYKPEPDRYEIVNRTHPRAILKNDAEVDLGDGKKKVLAQDSVVYITSSGGKACRISVDGITGLVATDALDFVPNGPDDIKVIYRANANANIYTEPSVKAEVITTVPEGTSLDVTKTQNSYCKVNIDGETGYVLKSKVSTFRQTAAVKAIWVKNDAAEKLDPDADVPDESGTDAPDPVN